MDIESSRELQILTEVSSGAYVTQRGLAKKLGVALGLANLLMRRLAKKGSIKIVNLHRNRVKYLITPGGISEKARLTFEYLEYSLHFYRQIRNFLDDTLTQRRPNGDDRLLLYGIGEIAEIAYLVVQQHGLRVAGIIDETPERPATFLSYPIQPFTALTPATWDWVIVTSLTDREAACRRCLDAGIPEDRVISIPDTPALFQRRRAAAKDDRALPVSMVSDTKRDMVALVPGTHTED